MTRLLLFFLMLGPACLVTALSRHRRTEEVLAPACMATMVVLYLFYVVNQLLIGFYVSIGLLLACWAAGLWLHLRRFSKEKWFCFVSPGSVVFLVSLIIIWLITRQSQPRQWDELRLWAAVPRALYFSDELQLGPDCLTYPMMQSYYPGIALFQYFFQKLGPAFNENGLFYAYAFLGLTLMIPCCQALDWKKGLWILPLSFLLVMLPRTFYSGADDVYGYYHCIFIDPLLGMTFAYNLYALWKLRSHQRPFEWAAYILSLCMLVLLKDSGLLLVVISMVLCPLLLGCKAKKTWVGLLFTVIAVAVTVIPWKILLAKYDVHNHIGFYDNPLRILKEWTLSQRQVDTIREFFHPLFTTDDLTGTNYPLFWNMLPFGRSWLYFSLVFAGWSLLLWRAFRKTEQPVAGLMVGLHISNIVYLIGLLVLFVCAMGGTPSYKRYAGTMTQAMMNLLTMLSLEAFIRYPLSQRIKAGFGILAVVFVVSFTFELPDMIYHPDVDPVAHSVHHVAQITWQMPADEDKEEPVDLFMVQSIQPGGNHHQVYFRLIDHNIRMKNYYTKVKPEVDYADAEAWLNALVTDGYDYVYLDSFTSEFLAKMSDLFLDGEPEICRLYTVTPEGLVKASPEFVPTSFMEAEE